MANAWHRVLVLALVETVGIAAVCITPAQAAEDRTIASFDTDFDGWTVAGNAFGGGPVGTSIGGQQTVSGWLGAGYANSFHGGDAATGELLSPEFVIDRDHISMLLGGGNHAGAVGAALIIRGKEVLTTTGSDVEQLLWHNWDVRSFRGKRARIRVFDHVAGGWGHVLVDEVLLTDLPRSSYDQAKLDTYRQSPNYYREQYRPQYHFTPEVNWMNDPNGLVYLDGEYHLFYQHNPYGNAWGHMSWGHAVSRDLVHWRHLPIALWEEHGDMIFSGCAVVDRGNTSGLGNDSDPLVAIYTSHRRGKQAQCLAYSNDRGRSWTKYEGNPVLDLQVQDFRDPKVFWHEPTQRWVMVVSMAIEKRLQFYGSADLKQWDLLSEFGPAGASHKPNWECPDLFELPIEDPSGHPTGETAWVVEVDMGDGSVAGGSGGEYFIGDFDGEQFTCTDARNPGHWLDYGRDFYAPVSWSDIPPEDGRRIWIGWMNNWQTHLLPTSPWRSAMSLPRKLGLRKRSEKIVLVQQPVEELRNLRKQPRRLRNVSIGNKLDLSESISLSGSQLEIDLEIALNGSERVCLGVLVGKSAQTLVGYDASEQVLFIDRRRSGNVDFHPAFAGVHKAPLKLGQDRLRLHVFVDSSSIEVFADGGAVVLTDRVFPPDDADRVFLSSQGESAQIFRLDAWTLSSSWLKP